MKKRIKVLSAILACCMLLSFAAISASASTISSAMSTVTAEVAEVAYIIEVPESIVLTYESLDTVEVDITLCEGAVLNKGTIDVSAEGSGIDDAYTIVNGGAFVDYQVSREDGVAFSSLAPGRKITSFAVDDDLLEDGATTADVTNKFYLKVKNWDGATLAGKYNGTIDFTGEFKPYVTPVAYDELAATVTNNSDTAQKFALFAEPGTATAKSISVTAMATITVQPGESISFNWDDYYSLIWGKVSESMFTQYESVDADPTDEDYQARFLDYSDGDFAFKVSSSVIAAPGALTIATDNGFTKGDAYVGLAIGGKPTVIVAAQENMMYTFMPNFEYAIAALECSEGEIVSLGTVNPPLATMKFEDGNTKAELAFSAEGALTVTGYSK